MKYFYMIYFNSIVMARFLALVIQCYPSVHKSHLNFFNGNDMNLNKFCICFSKISFTREQRCFSSKRASIRWNVSLIIIRNLTINVRHFRLEEILIKGNYDLNYSAGGSTQNTLRTISVKEKSFFDKSTYFSVFFSGYLNKLMSLFVWVVLDRMNPVEY